ncbi:MAG: ABC transporter substrate-binding protein [Pseudomonadota bacterium]
MTSLPLHLLATPPSDAAIAIGLPIDTAAHGTCLIAAAHLAIALHHQQGGLPVRPVWCDDHRSADGGRVAAAHLADRGIRYVIGHFSSRAAMTAAPIYADAGIVFLAPGASAPALTESPAPSTVLRLFGRDDTQANAIVQMLQRLESTPDIEIYVEDNRYGHSLGAHLEAALAHADMTAHIMSGRDEGDVRSIRTGPVVLAGTREFSARLLQRLDRTRLRIAGDDAYHAAFLVEAGPAADGVLIPVIKPPAEHGIAADLDAAYRTLIGRAPGAYFPTSYVAVDLLLRVLRRLGDCGGMRAAACLRGQSWSTLLGELSFTPSGEVTGLSWRTARIAQRQFIVT